VQVPLNPGSVPAESRSAESCTIAAAKTRIPYKITYFITLFSYLLLLSGSLGLVSL